MTPNGPKTARAGGARNRHSGVLHVFNRMEIGGAELRAVELVQRTGKAFDFIAVSGLSGRLDDQLRIDGHRVYLIRLSLRTLGKYLRLFRSRRYRVIHSNIGLASGPIVLLAWLAGCRSRIVHFQSDAVGGTDSVKKTVFLWVSRQLISILATEIVGVSPGSLSFGWKRSWSNDPRCSVIPNGFDTDLLRMQAQQGRLQRTDQRVEVVNVGRPDPVKNRGRAIEIWTRFAANNATRLVLVGALNPADGARVNESISSGSAIDLIGDSDRVASHLGSADVMLMTSLREGLPGVVLEALAVGVPVVATRLPGTEWIASQVSGVEMCSLDAKNEEWVAAMNRALATSPDAIRADFDRSPFTMRQAVESFQRLWGLQQ